jgi:hypothetical protein
MEIKYVILGLLVILIIIFVLPYYLFIYGSAIIKIIPYEGICSDMSMPKNAILFAYEHMITKENVTFVSIEPNRWEGTCERHYWVTDTNGISYRLVWSKMHNEIELNKSYTIRYLDGTFNALWEYE